MAGVINLVHPANLAQRSSGRSCFTRIAKTGVCVLVEVLPNQVTATTYPVAVNEGISANLTLPALSVSGTVTAQPLSGGNLTLPALTLVAYTGGNAGLVLPALTLSATATFLSVLRADLRLPALTMSGTVTTGSTINASLGLSALTLVAETGWNAGLTLPGGYGLTSNVISGGTVNADLHLPALTLNGGLSVEPHYRAELTLPSLQMAPSMHAWLTLPSLTMHAVVNEVVAVTYEAYAINLTTGAVSHYTNYPFDNILRFGSSYYGVSATGLYLIGGDLDLIVPIDSHIKTFATKLGSQNQKRVPYVYSSGRSDGGVIVGVTADEGETYEYESDWGEVAGSTNHRTTVGKGVKGVYYSFDVKNVNGGSLELDEISVHVAPTQRAI